MKKNKPVIGLALGGGGARGFAHLGILKVLAQYGLNIEIVAGTSIGAIVGAAYAAGYPIDEMIAIAKSNDWKKLLKMVDLSLPAKGLIKGRKIEDYLRGLLRDKNFANLSKRLVVVATDIETGREEWIDKGDIIRAIHASIAIPGIFEPVKINDSIYVDGSITAPVPWKAAFAAGADIVIAVDVSSPMTGTEYLYKLSYIFQSDWYKRISQKTGVDYYVNNILPASIRIVSKSLKLNKMVSRSDQINSRNMFTVRPDLGDIRWYDFHRIEDCITAGEVKQKNIEEKLFSAFKTSFTNTLGWEGKELSQHALNRWQNTDL